MAFSGNTEWDVRTTGSDANGGGFDTSSSGTDRSQGNTAFQAYTDLVIGGTNTQITSAAHPFDATSPGNVINITGGTGFTVQRVQIVSVAGAVATCDKAVGTAASTGGTGNLGGSLLTISKAASLCAGGNTVHIKAGTYTFTSGVNTSAPTRFSGYNATHNDRGTKPLITTATNNTYLLDSLDSSQYSNISFSNTASVKQSALPCGNAAVVVNVEGCIFDGFTYAVVGENSVASPAALIMSGCEIKNCTLGGVALWFQVLIHGCYFHNNSGSCVAKLSAQNDACSITHTIFANNNNNAVDGSNLTGELFIVNCTFANNTGNAVINSLNGTCINNIFYGQGGFAINTTLTGIVVSNAFGNNALGNYVLATGPRVVSLGEVALTASPFTNAAAGDYSLNSTAGGGALCKGAGFPGAFPGGTSTGTLDMGAVQAGGGGSGGGGGGGGVLGGPPGFSG